MGLMEAMFISLITSVVSSAGTIAALKIDINWINKARPGTTNTQIGGLSWLKDVASAKAVSKTVS